jgi:hypothetical protein
MKVYGIAVLLATLVLTTSCQAFQGTVDFGPIKIPNILVFIIAVGFMWWYLFKRQ